MHPILYPLLPAARVSTREEESIPLFDQKQIVRAQIIVQGVALISRVRG